MAKIPYQAYPERGPGDIPMPEMNIRVDADMFGASVGRSMQGFGQELAQAGDRLFNDAMLIKHSNEETEVNKAVTQNLIAAGELDNKFRQLQGQDAEKARPDHIKALDETRNSFRDSLSSPRAKKIFDQETMRRFGYDVINASNWSATQAKKAAAESAKATRAAIAEGIMRDPFNDKFIDYTVDGLAGRIKADPDNIGDDAATIDLKVKTEIGLTISKAAAERAKTDPGLARALLDRYKPIIGDIAYEKAMDTVNDRGSDLYARRAAREITGGSTMMIEERKANNSIKTETLSPEFRTRLGPALREAERRVGEQAIITSASRSTLEQSILRRKYEAGIGGLAAPPGTSRHEVGEAVDLAPGKVLDELRKMWQNGELKKYGLEFLSDKSGKPLMSDTVHLQLSKTDEPDPTVLDQATTKIAGGVVGESAEARYVRYVKQMEELADKLYPDPKDGVWKEKFLERGLANIQKNSAVQARALNDQVRTNWNVIQSVLNKFDPKTGNGPRSIEEAERIDPQFRAKVEEAQKLDPTITRKVEQSFIYNSKQDVYPTKEAWDRWQAARKMMNAAKAGVVSPDEALSLSPASLDLPRAWHADIVNLQEKLRNQKIADLKMTTYLHNVQDLLNDREIYQSRTNREANRQYIEFSGAFYERLQEFQAKNNNKPATYEEQRKIAAELLAAAPSTSTWYNPFSWGGRSNFAVPQEFIKEWAPKFKKKYDRDPDPGEMAKMYQRSLRGRAVNADED